jgi:hypothetical protein
LFEYNFGDSEFLMLFLILITLPFAADVDDADRPALPTPPARGPLDPVRARQRVRGDARVP